MEGGEMGYLDRRQDSSVSDRRQGHPAAALACELVRAYKTALVSLGSRVHRIVPASRFRDKRGAIASTGTRTNPAQSSSDERSSASWIIASIGKFEWYMAIYCL